MKIIVLLNSQILQPNSLTQPYSLKIYNYKDKYNINIDLQFGDYVISKYLDDYYVCEVECKTQNEVISLLK